MPTKCTNFPASPLTKHFILSFCCYFLSVYAVVRCPQLATPANGHVKYPRDPRYGSMATYSCRGGYGLVGPQSRMCQASGEWSDLPPSCRSEFFATTGNFCCKLLFANLECCCCCLFVGIIFLFLLSQRCYDKLTTLLLCVLLLQGALAEHCHTLKMGLCVWIASESEAMRFTCVTKVTTCPATSIGCVTCWATGQVTLQHV